MHLAVSKRDLPFLWKVLTKQHPEIANKIASSYVPTIPYDSNLDNISYYFLTFCRITSTEPDDLIFVKYKTETVDLKRVFVACLLAIYSPDVLKHSPDIAAPKWGMASAAGATIRCPKQYVNRLMSQASAQYKIYDDFRERVDEISQQMKGGK